MSSKHSIDAQLRMPCNNVEHNDDYYLLRELQNSNSDLVIAHGSMAAQHENKCKMI
jgi:hypothetical protein